MSIFDWLFSSKQVELPEVQEETKEKPRGVTLVVGSGTLRDFEAWCKLNNINDPAQQYTRNVVTEANVLSLGVENVENIVFTGKFWENSIMMSPYFRNFFREWEKLNATKAH